MRKQVLLGVALAALIAGGPSLAIAEGTTMEGAPALGQPAAIDAAKLVGQNVLDIHGATIGEIDAVLVNADGAVQSVVVDASGWLESEKLLNLNWSSLAQGPDGEIVATNLSKEQAQLAEGYAYRGDAKSGQILTETGEPYQGLGNEQPAAATQTAEQDSLLRNGDGSVNTSNLIGATLENGSGDKLGEIDEVVVHPDGKVQGVVVDVGGLLGVGAHSVLLDWQDLEMAQRDGRDILMINATEDSLKAMPEYTPTTAQ